MSNIKKNKIIIIGGGYAGLRTVEKLAKSQNNEITLIDKNSYHFMQTDVYDLIANEDDFSQVTVDLFTYSIGFNDNVTFIKQEVKDIDFTHKKVITDKQRLSYDYLVIAVGSRTKFIANVDGLQKYAYGIKALHRAMYFKQKFEMSLFNKVEESGNYCSPLNIVVAGAGLSGVEIAAQMASFSREFYYRNNFICRKLNIMLINSAEHILYGMDENLVTHATKRLKDLGVIIKNKQKVVKVSEDKVTLSGGEVLFNDFTIFAGGIEPNGLVWNLNLEKNQYGYISINEHLQVNNHAQVYAIGDCAALYNNDKIIAPTADVAEQMAEVCAKNIQNTIDNKSLIKQNISSRGIIIALGRGYASAKIYNYFFHGYLAYIMKKVVEKIYAKRLDIRSNKGCRKIF